MDFVLFYEHRARELAGICLLKLELERRGYSVRISNTIYWRYLATILFSKPKIAVVPFLYDDVDVTRFQRFIRGRPECIVDIQCEQVRTRAIRQEGKRYPTGSAKEYPHLCWGNQIREYMSQNGIDESKLPVTGSLEVDLDLPQFRQLFPARNALAREYGLDAAMKWCLFISSFTITTYSDERVSTTNERFGFSGLDERRKLAIKNRDEILQWIEKFLQAYPEYIYIYRPHPSEAAQPDLLALQKKYSNFRVIGELSIKAWIMAADVLYNYFSTSIIDVYFLQKSCAILRPYDIPEYLDNELMVDGKFVKTYEEFEAYTLSPNEVGFPISEQKVCSFFANNNDKTAYNKICDYLEHIYHNPPEQPPVPAVTKKEAWYKTLLYGLFSMLATWCRFAGLIKGRFRKTATVLQRECYQIRKEIKSHSNALSKIIRGVK